MPRFADVMLFLAAERADERLEAVTYLENRLPVREDKGVFEQRIEQNRHMADIVHTYTEILLAGKKRFHVLDAESGNAKQMISVGASHNTCHLFTGKIATKGERWSVSGIFYT